MWKFMNIYKKKIAGRYNLELIEKSFANNSAFPVKVVTKTSKVRVKKEVVELFLRYIFACDQKDLLLFGQERTLSII